MTPVFNTMHIFFQLMFVDIRVSRRNNGKISSLIFYSETFYSNCAGQSVTGNLTVASMQNWNWTTGQVMVSIRTKFALFSCEMFTQISHFISLSSKEYCSALTFDKFHLKISHYPNAFNAQWLLIISDFSLIIPQCQQHEIGFLSSVDIYGWDNQPLECRRSSSAAKKRTICKTMLKQNNVKCEI